MIGPRVAAQRRQDADEHGQQDGEQDGWDGDLQGGRDAGGEFVEHRSAGAEGGAELTSEQSGHESGVLHEERIVEAVRLAELLELPWRRRLVLLAVEDELGRVARGQVGEQEGDERDAEPDR